MRFDCDIINTRGQEAANKGRQAMDIKSLTDAINTEITARQNRQEIIEEINRLRLIDEVVPAMLIEQADATFQTSVDAYNTMRAAILAAKAAGVERAQGMAVPMERPAAILAMEYKPIRRAGGRLY